MATRLRVPAAERTLSALGLALIAEFEGFVATPYNDVAGHATIGFGHLLHHGPVTALDRSRWGTLTRARALAILDADADIAETGVRRLVKVTVSQGEFDALVSFAFNVGLGALAESTLLRRLNAGKRTAAMLEFARWTRAGGRVVGGLVRRRLAEAYLFASGSERMTATLDRVLARAGQAR